MPTPNSSVYHAVPIMIQPNGSSCWYTSFQMVVKYQRSRNRGQGLRDPSEVPWVKAIYDAGNGIGAITTPGQPSDERERVATALGFTCLFSSLTAEGVWELMSEVPLIYAGRWPGHASGHFVVLVGISENRIAINNPLTGQDTRDYNQFVSQYLEQTIERPLIHPPY